MLEARVVKVSFFFHKFDSFSAARTTLRAVAQSLLALLGWLLARVIMGCL